jgi:ribose 5-phosphate isomerase A
MIDVAREKQLAAQEAASFVEDHMTVGLGTGSTVAFLLPALAQTQRQIRCVATSPHTEAIARQLGLVVEPFTDVSSLDIAIDGADQISTEGWLVKGGGAAHTREKLVAITAQHFVVIADSSKVVERIHGPIPLELLAFGLGSTLRRLGGSAVTLRDVPLSPDGGVIGDYHGSVDDPQALASWFSATPGVVDHGLFPPSMVGTILIGHTDGTVERRTISATS